MNGHRSGASHDDKQVYQHFQLPGHSPSDIKAQILEKVHKEFGSTKLTKPERERVKLTKPERERVKLTKPERERVKLKWIKELGTAAPYGLNDKINGARALKFPSTSEVNRIGVCNKQVRRRRAMVIEKQPLLLEDNCQQLMNW